MKVLGSLLVGLLLSGLVSAQSNYKSGYVITAEKDTLKGFIDFQEWIKSPVSVKFKQQQADKNYTTFYPSTIREFKIQDVVEYISFEGNISADEIFFPNLPANLDTAVVHKTVFLEKLTPGKAINLYYHRDEIRHRFFIQDINGPIQELVYHEYYNDDKKYDEKKKVLKDFKYKQQLTLLIGKYLQNNAGLIDKLDNVSYDKNELKKIINALNLGNGSVSIQSTEEIRASHFNFYAGVGVNYAKMKVSGQLDLSAAPASNSYGPLLYAGVTFYPGEKTKRLAIQAEVSAWRSNHEFTALSRFSEVTPRYRGALDEWSVKRFNLSVSPTVLYSFYNSRAIKFYGGVGFSIDFSSFDNSHILIDPSTNVKFFDLNEIALKKSWINFPLKAGFVVANKLDVTFKYLPSINISNYMVSSVSGHVMSLGTAYIF